jgi:hypothetical protein
MSAHPNGFCMPANMLWDSAFKYARWDDHMVCFTGQSEDRYKACMDYAGKTGVPADKQECWCSDTKGYVDKSCDDGGIIGWFSKLGIFAYVIGGLVVGGLILLYMR